MVWHQETMDSKEQFQELEVVELEKDDFSAI